MKKIIIILLATCLFAISAQAQKLGDMEGQMSGGGDSNSSSDSEWFWVDLFFEIGFYPTYGLLFGFENEPRASEIDFNAYPYAEGYSDGDYLPLDYPGKQMRLQMTGHIQTNEDAVYGGYLQARWSPNRYLSLDVNHLGLFEELEDDDTDHLNITNFNLQINRVRQPKFNLWWGGGLMLIDRENLYGSPSASGGFTWFFRRPLSLHAEVQMGWPNGTFARQYQARMQVHVERLMVYAGYQGTKIGSVGIPSWSVGTGVYF